MVNNLIETRNNKSSNLGLQHLITAVIIVLFFSIYQSVLFKKVSFSVLNISVMILIWGLTIWLELMRRKTIEIYSSHIVITSKNGSKMKFNTSELYLKIVTHPAQSLKTTRTLQLRRKDTHRKVFSIEPKNRKDDKYLETILTDNCNIKIKNWE